jgi:hypothetical protein
MHIPLYTFSQSFDESAEIKALRKEYLAKRDELLNTLQKEFSEKGLELCAKVGPHDWNVWENNPYVNVMGVVSDNYFRYCKRCGAIEYSQEKPNGEIEEHEIDRWAFL